MLSQSQEVFSLPTWFESALNHKAELTDIEVDGRRIHVRAWGCTDQPPLVFVHGAGAHGGWWEHIAPFFADSHRVIAPDLSGHGDSEFRDRYALRTWAREVMAAAQFGTSGLPTIVGHGMGGWVATRAAQQYREGVDAIAAIDSPLRAHTPKASHLRRHSPRTATFQGREDFLAQAESVREQKTVLPYIGRHIAATSVRRTISGWDWKVDRAVCTTPLFGDREADQELMERISAEMPCRVAYLRCGDGCVPLDAAGKIRSAMQLRGPFIELPEAGHYPMLDQPLQLITALRTLLEMWSIT
ncbi:alpha/beta fold hydrolase [Mycolicibacterium helvum]|uniref:Alpha/beta hydrolase n=1 Tax=Mycolicibacterium helvum TaxID=1534349 RepID=A0A7I7TC34_9MYCO|nr:alpha/beta hydrolase [Mycolicibacterium helvum]